MLQHYEPSQEGCHEQNDLVRQVAQDTGVKVDAARAVDSVFDNISDL